MCVIIMSENRCMCDNNGSRQTVNTHFLLNLIISSLNKSSIRGKYRFTAAFCHCCSHCNRILFCYSHINVLFSCKFSSFFVKTDTYRCGCRYNCNFRIFLHLAKQMLRNNIPIIFHYIRIFSFPCFLVKRACPMPVFFILFCGLKALSFLGTDMNHYRHFCVLYVIQCFNYRFYVIPLLH